MAVKMRLKRMGAKKRPFYRIVVADSRSPRDGRFIEEVGYYNPIENPAVVKVNKEIALKWLNNGAAPTDTVRDILSKEGILKEFHESKMSKKSVKVEKELGVEVVGETKVKIAIEEEEDPWDEIDDELSNQDIEEIDNVKEDFIK